jgi:membrane-bound lytic murein transglycosylase MltF
MPLRSTRTRSPFVVALSFFTLQWCLACQAPRPSPSGRDTSHSAASSSGATERPGETSDGATAGQDETREPHIGPGRVLHIGAGPTAKDATAEGPDELARGTAGNAAGIPGDYQITSGTPGSQTGAAPTEGQALSDEFMARMLAPWQGDLPGIKERRYLRMLVTFNRTHYFADRLQQHGLTYDGGKLFEKFLNQRLNTGTVEIHVVFIPVTRDRLFQALAEGKGDVAAAGLTITPERETKVSFAPPFLTNVREIVVTSATQPPVATAEDLSGRSVHVRKSSSFYESLTELNRRLAAQGKAPVKIVTVSEELETEDLLEMVNADLIQITIADDYLAEFWAMVFDDIRLQPATVRTGGELAWAVRKNAPELQQAVGAFARANAKGSANYNMIYNRYLRSADYVKHATSPREMEKFRRIRGLFQKYGAQYDLPWPLLAAQGYQESQLEQARTSGAGAVGLMQIKPSTAAGAPINVTGVETSADQNVKAGVKYLRFIVDRYYKDTPMDRVNKGLFAIASYNAGPARIAQLRQKAAALGFNPNKWFGNVEVVAAREIGRETVNYVSNIYKYYVSYRLTLQQIEARRRARTQVGPVPG